MSYDLIKVGNRLSFNLIPAAILGARVTNLEVIGVVDYKIARLSDDVDSRHAQVYPSLPQGTPNDPKAYAYAILQALNGTLSVIGIPWIQESSIILESNARCIITLDNVPVIGRSRLQALLIANNFPISSFVVVNQ